MIHIYNEVSETSLNIVLSFPSTRDLWKKRVKHSCHFQWNNLNQSGGPASENTTPACCFQTTPPATTTTTLQQLCEVGPTLLFSYIKGKLVAESICPYKLVSKQSQKLNTVYKTPRLLQVELS